MVIFHSYVGNFHSIARQIVCWRWIWQSCWSRRCDEQREATVSAGCRRVGHVFFPPSFHRSVFEQEKWTAKEKRYFNRQKRVMDRNVSPKCPKTLHLEQWIAIRQMKPYETSWSHGCKLWVPQHALDPAAVCKFGGPWTHRLHNLPGRNGRNGDIRPKWQFD